MYLFPINVLRKKKYVSVYLCVSDPGHSDCVSVKHLVGGFLCVLCVLLVFFFPQSPFVIRYLHFSTKRLYHIIVTDF